MKLKLHIIILLLTSVVVFGQDEGQAARETGLMFEGTFEKAAVVSEVKGAKKTQLVAAHTEGYGVRPFTDKTWKDSGLKWEFFSEWAGKTADEIAKAIKPQYIRNHRGVIDYAIVRGDSPFFTSAITSPHFVDPFTETLGDRLHVVIIDRNVMYVFPGTGGSLGDYGPALVQIYKRTPLPVSLEIFEVTAHTYQVIGEIDRGTNTNYEVPTASSENSQ